MQRSRRVRILHVDDDASFVRTVADALAAERDSFEVLEETDPTAVPDRIEASPVDCIVSDYEMEEMDGLELLDAVREWYPGLPFILYTGRGTEAVASEAISAGVTDYIQKSHDIDQITVLANRIDNAVEQRERDRQFRTLLDNLPGIVYSTRQKRGWPMTFIGGEVEGLTGYSREAFDSGSVSFGEDLIHPNDRDRVWQEIESHDPGTSFELTYRIITNGGEERWVWERCQVIADPEGVSLVEGFITDITEKQKRKRDIERLETFLENSSDVIVHLDADGTMRYQSPGTQWVFEHEPELNVGKNVFEFVHPDDSERVLERFGSVLADPDRRFDSIELRLQDDQGEYVWVEALGVGQTDTELGGVIVSVRDITARKEREQELAAYGETLEALQSSTRKLLGADSREQVAEKAIQSLEEVLEFDLSGLWFAAETADRLEPVATTVCVEDLIDEPPNYTPDSQSLSWDAYTANSITVVDEMRHHDGRHREDTAIRSEIIVPLDDHGVLNVGATEPAAFDDSEVTLVELWAGSVTAVLDRIERERELKRREAELRRERDRLDEFAGVVSHDLRNPLNVATGRLELARQECESDHLESIATGLQRMEDLIRDSLALARQGETVVETDPVTLSTLVDGCVETVGIDSESVRVESDITVRADENRLAQVVENLLRNAEDHADNPTVTVGTVSDGSGFFVADDGPGFPEGATQNIFESGYTTDSNGTGLGLAIVRQIVQAHGWEIRARNDGGGARFEITGVDIVENAP